MMEYILSAMLRKLVSGLSRIILLVCLEDVPGENKDHL